MPNFNKVILAGHLTRDVELRYSPKGTAIGQFSIAVNNTWTNAAGEKKEDVCFVDCQAWGKTAETLAQYTKQGHPLLVEGRLKGESWEDKTTKQKRSKLLLVLESFSFLKGKSPETAKPVPTAEPEDDVPF